MIESGEDIDKEGKKAHDPTLKHYSIQYSNYKEGADK